MCVRESLPIGNRFAYPNGARTGFPHCQAGRSVGQVEARTTSDGGRRIRRGAAKTAAVSTVARRYA